MRHLRYASVTAHCTMYIYNASNFGDGENKSLSRCLGRVESASRAGSCTWTVPLITFKFVRALLILVENWGDLRSFEHFESVIRPAEVAYYGLVELIHIRFYNSFECCI